MCEAGAVTIFEKGQAAARKFLFDKVLNDRLLVFDRGVVPIQFLIDGNSAVSGNIKSLYQFYNHLFNRLLSTL